MFLQSMSIEGNTLSWTDKCREDRHLLQAYLMSDHCLKWTFTIHQIPKISYDCLDALIKLRESVIGFVMLSIIVYLI